ncbi:MAG TPA: choice-of-anchor tandem repeat GloVer-containing protein [Rhizomicrobium sp.]|nr:choice-of-anchor tandem repeat GloVer-containing protein [Rhizomicrobium sp.]
MSQRKTRNPRARLRSVAALPLCVAVLMTYGILGAAAGGGGFKVLYNFNNQSGSGGAFPVDGVVRDSAGNLYGMTFYGYGVSTPGLVYKVAPDGTETVLHQFTNGSDGGDPEYDLVLDEAGNVYGTALAGGADGTGLVFELAPDGTETVIHSFTNESPRSGVMRDRNGDFYGTAAGGCCGLVYKLGKDGTETVLYTFTGGGDGDGPAFSGRLVKDKAGNLYGTTVGGGAYGEGVVFKVAPSGTETVLHSFGAEGDGKIPEAGVVEGKAGNLYGTTYMGGGTGCGNGCGTVFQLAPDGTESVLYLFCSQPNCSDGGYPESGLVEDKAGNLYGTTTEGGTGPGCIDGCGTVFKLPADGGIETVLYSFTTTDGAVGVDVNDVSQGSPGENGDLYGTTQYGGTYSAGTVFKLKK